MYNPSDIINSWEERMKSFNKSNEKITKDYLKKLENVDDLKNIMDKNMKYPLFGTKHYLTDEEDQHLFELFEKTNEVYDRERFSQSFHHFFLCPYCDRWLYLRRPHLAKLVGKAYNGRTSPLD